MAPSGPSSMAPSGLAAPLVVRVAREAAAPSTLAVCSVAGGATGRLWTAGAGGSVNHAGFLCARASTNGALLQSVSSPSAVHALALVRTLKPCGSLRVGRPLAPELLLWAGMADGRIGVYGAAELAGGPRAMLAGHRGAVLCVHAPSAPPYAPEQGCAIVLSSAQDFQLRVWDARSGDCLRSVPCDGAHVMSIVSTWGGTSGVGTNGSREGLGAPRCRVWSVAANGTLSIWEPQLPPLPKAGKPAQVQSIALGADIIQLDASADGKLVGAAAGGERRSRARITHVHYHRVSCPAQGAHLARATLSRPRRPVMNVCVNLLTRRPFTCPTSV